MRITILTDLFDPSKGSEFQVAQKAIKACCAEKNGSVALWTLRRVNNSVAIDRWLADQGLSIKVRVNLVDMQYANDSGDHPTPLHFALDLMRLYRCCLRSLSENDILWKCGQVNFLFNLPFLALRRRMIVGPVSGFEYPPLIWIANAQHWRLALKYSLYTLLIACARGFTRFLLKLPRRFRFDLLLATGTDYKAIAGWPQSRTRTRFHRFTEIDLDELLSRTWQPPSRSLGRIHSLKQPSQRVVLWSGNFVARKNPQLAAEVLIAFLHKNPQSMACMVGDGPLFEQVEKYAEQASIAGNRLQMRRSLPRSEFLELLSQADALLVTSWREVNSVLVFEALAADLGILSSHVSGMRETVSYNGVTYPLKASLDTSIIAKMLDDLLISRGKNSGRNYLKKQQILEKNTLQDLFRYNEKTNRERVTNHTGSG